MQAIEKIGVITAPLATITNYTFCYCPNLIKIGGFIAPKSNNLYGLFTTCRKLVEITQPLDISNATSIGEMFLHCSALEEVRFIEGCIHISISINRSPYLSDNSVQSIINGLADLTGKTAQVLSLDASVKEKLTDEQITRITSKNWTLA